MIAVVVNGHVDDDVDETYRHILSLYLSPELLFKHNILLGVLLYIYTCICRVYRTIIITIYGRTGGGYLCRINSLQESMNVRRNCVRVVAPPTAGTRRDCAGNLNPMHRRRHRNGGGRDDWWIPTSDEMVRRGVHTNTPLWLYTDGQRTGFLRSLLPSKTPRCCTHFLVFYTV